jgi:hypothetical protein
MLYKICFNFFPSRLQGLDKAVASNIEEWKQFVQSQKPHQMAIPIPYQELTGLDKIALLKCFRPDRFLQAAYVSFFFNTSST